MNREELREQIIEPTYLAIMELNTTKGHDYAGDEDALSNFKRNAERLKLTPEQVLMVYLGKHLDAIYTYCAEGQVESEPIEGRIDDAILYLLLLKGLVHESLDKKDKALKMQTPMPSYNIGGVIH